MRHLLAGGLILAAIIGAALFLTGGSGGEPLAERDRFFREEALVVTFEGTWGGQEYDATLGPLLVHLPDGRWLFHRVPGSTVAFTGDAHLAAVAPGCYLGVDPFELPLVPGITVARSILTRVEVEQDGGAQDFAYTIPRESPFTLDVREDLSALAGEGVVATRSSGGAQGVMNGTFTIRRATPEERAEASVLLDGASPSPTTTLTTRNRLLRPSIDGGEQGFWGEQTFTVLRDCPETLLSAPEGIEPWAIGLYTANLSLGVDTAGAPVFREAVPVTRPWGANEDALITDLAAAVPGDVPVRRGQLFATGIAGSAPADNRPWFVYEVLGCASTEWFRCGEPVEPPGI